MAIPNNIDLDIVTRAVLGDLEHVMRGWTGGWPTEETAFMNRFTEALRTRHDECDIGLTSPVYVSTRLIPLHRRGPDATDLFGADLAVTVHPPNGRFTKTAFFQFKKSANCKLRLRREQLNAACVDDRIKVRSFVVALDEMRHNVRIASVQSLLDQFPSGPLSRGYNSSSWMPVGVWLSRWLSCEEAPTSDRMDQNSVEGLLIKYAAGHGEQEVIWDADRLSGEPRPFPDGYTPARVWVLTDFDNQAETNEIFVPA
ncbi:hypothetical protein CfE428DRAFT_4740 [Chthoniobacter flavus Ellin428]|uniref:Uncharacterized protein n=1 Tax=Chthoniobacter flavus Ellin428 TaxID=497964 RepID=B4D750_9BACT|nr:hypothetical protein CfE428DRAFT_4740 [Chthoniobacter flavus Ellin428]TCO87027.1 hypothetical protein EV701_1244 [Chthoniobacter flavus]